MRFSVFTIILLLCGLQLAFAVTVGRQLPANETGSALISQPNCQFKDQTRLKLACGFAEEQSTRPGLIAQIEGVSEAILVPQVTASVESFFKVNGGAFIGLSVAKADNATLVVPDEALEEIGTLLTADNAALVVREEASAEIRTLPIDGPPLSVFLSGCKNEKEEFIVEKKEGKSRSVTCKWVTKVNSTKRRKERCRKKAFKKTNVNETDNDIRVSNFCQKKCAKVGIGPCVPKAA